MDYWEKKKDKHGDNRTLIDIIPYLVFEPLSRVNHFIMQHKNNRRHGGTRWTWIWQSVRTSMNRSQISSRNIALKRKKEINLKVCSYGTS